MKTRRWAPVGLCGAAVAVGLVAPIGRNHDGLTAVVPDEPFRDVLVERGRVSAARLRIYGSSIAGAQAKIAWIVAEGTHVSPGDVLLRFDATSFEQSRERELAALAQAEAEFLRAREDVALERIRTDEEIAAAGLQGIAAEQTLADEMNGAGPFAVAQAESTVNDAVREERRTQTAATDVRALLQEGFATRAEVDQAESAWRRAQEQLRLAGLGLTALTTYERPASIGRARAGATMARQGLDRTIQAVRARMAQRDAALHLAAARVRDAHAKVAMVQRQLDQTVVKADAHGLVVYRDLFFGSDRRKPQPGDEVFSNQPLIAVPDSQELVIETQAREWDLQRLSQASAVTVRIDAYPELAIAGTVQLVGALAQEDARQPGNRTFPVTIRLADPDARLRPGLSARVEMQTAHLPRALVLPLDAIRHDASGTFCVVAGGLGTRRVDVRVLATNDRDAAVQGNLRSGERVAIGPLE